AHRQRDESAVAETGHPLDRRRIEGGQRSDASAYPVDAPGTGARTFSVRRLRDDPDVIRNGPPADRKQRGRVLDRDLVLDASLTLWINFEQREHVRVLLAAHETHASALFGS